MNGQHKSATTQKTPITLLVSRLVFFVYIALAFLAVGGNWFPDSLFSPYWLVYMVVLYLGAEKLYAVFLRRGIDLTFGFPILLAVFGINAVSLALRGQETVPLINRAEHFTSFVLIGYIVWVFFLQYLPHDMWKKHPYYTSLIVLAVTSLAGVGNEIIELLFDKQFGTTLVGTGYDTSLDLLMNTLGSGLLLAVQLILKEGGIRN